MFENENADAHASDDCFVDCAHPDHLYLGDDDFWDLRTLMDLREMAERNSWHLGDVIRLLADDDIEGPITL